MRKFFRYVVDFEPALFRGIIVQVVAAAAIWGLDISLVGDQVAMTYALLFPIIGIIQSWLTRRAVVPLARHKALLNQVLVEESSPEDFIRDQQG